MAKVVTNEGQEDLMEVDGEWEIRIKSPMGTQVGTLELQTSNEELSGTMTARSETIAIAEGKVSGNDLTWVIRRRKPIPMTATFSATIDGDTMAGRAKMGPLGDHSFECSRKD